jgi:hypothetical protein
MLIPAGPVPAIHADIFHAASILLAVKGNFYERKRRKDKVRKCCRFFGLYAGEEVILDESSVPIPEQRSFFLSSIGSFLTKSVFPSITLLSFFASAMVKSTSGGSSSSQEAVFLILDV